MTKYTDKWRISFPEGTQKVAVPKDVKATAATTDAAITESVTSYEQDTIAMLLVSGAGVEATNHHPNPGAEYDTPVYVAAQGSTTTVRSGEWAATGSNSVKVTHTEDTGNPTNCAAIPAMALGGANNAVYQFTLHNAADAQRAFYVEGFVSEGGDQGSPGSNGNGALRLSYVLAAGESRRITVPVPDAASVYPTGDHVRCRIWRRVDSAFFPHTADDVFHLDDIFVGIGTTETPDRPFDGDQALVAWDGTPGRSTSTGVIGLGEDTGGGGAGSGPPGAVYVSTEGDDGNDGTSWGHALATLDAAFEAARFLASPTIYLSPGTHLRPASGGVGNNMIIQGAGRGITIITSPPEYDTLPVLGNANPSSGNFRFTIRDLTLDGVKGQRPADAVWTSTTNYIEPGTGLLLQKCGDFVIENVEIRNAVRRGVFIRGWGVPNSRNGVLSNLWVHDNGTAGIHVGHAQRAMQYSNVYCELNGGHVAEKFETDANLKGCGLAMDHSESSITGAYLYANNGHGLYVRNVFSNNITGVQANRNGKHGIYLSGVTFSAGSSWTAHGNGWATPDTAAFPDGWAEVFFAAGVYDDPAGTTRYGPTDQSVITAIAAGPTDSDNWKLPDTGPKPQAASWAIYAETPAASTAAITAVLAGVATRAGSAGDIHLGTGNNITII